MRTQGEMLKRCFQCGYFDLFIFTHLLTNLASIELVTGKDVDDGKQHTHCRIILSFLKSVTEGK